MPPLPSLLGHSKRAGGAPGAVGTASLHSSNDSGFSNEPPPQPEVDYSDDEGARPAASPTNANGTTANGSGPPGKKKLLSSVRGWLLYKSALELMDDVNTHQQQRPPAPSGATPRSKKPGPLRKSGAVASRPLAMRQASSVGHLATLGRLSMPKGTSASHDALATPPRRGTPLADDVTYAPGGTLVKRSKSLWKFKRAKDDILEGMALWQHRSLIDVNAAVEAEPTHGRGDKHVPGGTPAQVEDATRENATHENATRESSRATPQVADGASGQKPRRARDLDDDGLQQSLSSDVDDDTATESSGEDDSSDSADTESCIVVDDHMRESSLKRRRQHDQKQQQQQARRQVDDAEETDAPVNTSGSLLPRTRLVKPRPRHVQNGHGNHNDVNGHGVNGHGTHNSVNGHAGVNGHSGPRKAPRRKTQHDASSPTSDGAGDGLLQYGRSLQKRLSKPDRGSRFDQKSETTGNRCGPWYDLWGMDPSVVERR